MDDAGIMDRPQAGAGWGWMMAAGVVSELVGLAAVIWPFPATFAATIIVGAFFLAAGVVAIGAGAFGRGHGRRGYLVAFGLLSAIVGLMLAFFPLSGALTLTLLVAIWLAVRGIMELVTASRVAAHRGLMIVLGIVNLILAAMIYFNVPWSALTLPGYMLGISFLFGGVTEITAASSHRRGAPAFAAA